MYFPVSLGDTVTEADKLLYQTLLRHDYIYYYLYKLNFAKSLDFTNIARYEAELKQIPDIADSIQIEDEKRKSIFYKMPPGTPKKPQIPVPNDRIRCELGVK